MYTWNFYLCIYSKRIREILEAINIIICYTHNRTKYITISNDKIIEKSARLYYNIAYRFNRVTLACERRRFFFFLILISIYNSPLQRNVMYWQRLSLWWREKMIFFSSSFRRIIEITVTAFGHSLRVSRRPKTRNFFFFFQACSPTRTRAILRLHHNNLSKNCLSCRSALACH